MLAGQEFLEYYNKFKDKIFNYFWYRVNFNRDLAEDLTSEVFIKTLENFDSFEHGRFFQAWIYKIAHNHLVNYYRVANREVDLGQVANFFGDDTKKLNISMELEKLLQEINKLEPYYRDVLILRFVDGLNNQEIAELLEKDEGTVRTQISRAMQAVKTKFGLQFKDVI